MLEKFKSVILKDEVFYGLLIVLVGVASFGLGKLSTYDDALVPATQSAGVTLSRQIEREDARTSEAQDEYVASEVSEKVYVGSKNGTKFHFPWCSGAQRILEENKVWFETQEEATRAGYTPAGNCKGL